MNSLTENRAPQTNPVIEENPSYVIQASDDQKKLQELSQEVHRYGCREIVTLSLRESEKWTVIFLREKWTVILLATTLFIG